MYLRITTSSPLFRGILNAGYIQIYSVIRFRKDLSGCFNFLPDSQNKITIMNAVSELNILKEMIAIYMCLFDLNGISKFECM
jgi:hypothetical protein